MSKDILIPPNNLDAERSLLGAQLLTGPYGASKFADKIAALPELITTADYYADVHRFVQKAIWNVYERTGGSVDVLLVADELESMGKLGDAGGVAYLAELMAAVPDSHHAPHYAEIVASHSRRRKAIAVGQEMIKKAHDPGCDDQVFIENAHDAAMKMAEMLNVRGGRPRPIEEHVSELIAKLRRGEIPTVYWGIHPIDQMIGGVAPGELVIIGACPSTGKTMVVLQWLQEAALKRIPGLMFSEEMSPSSLATRSLTTLSAVNHREWLSSTDQLESDRVDYFANRAPLLIAEKCHSIVKIEREIDRCVQSHGIRIVGVDYAQIVEGRGSTTEEKVADVAKSLKGMAMKHNLVVILLAQLNRGINNRDDSTPRLSDLKASGGLEAEADVALFPYWPWKMNDTYEDKTEYRIYHRKNRNRGIRESAVKLRIDPDRQRIFESETQADMSDYFQ